MDFPTMKLTVHKSVIGGHWTLNVTVDEVNGKPSKLSGLASFVNDPKETAKLAGDLVSAVVEKALQES